MADITNTSGNGHRKHHGHRIAKPAPRVDLTPMVDLGFLLITFFMLTMQMNTSKAMLWEKKISESPPEPVSECCVLNILVDSGNRVFTYEGYDFKTLTLSSFSNDSGIIRAIILKGKKVKAECGLTKAGEPHKLICLIKLLPGTRYQNLTDAVDEMAITKTSYSIQDPLPEEIEALKEKELLATR